MSTMSVSSSYPSSSSSILSSSTRSSFNFLTITAAELEPIKLFLQSALKNKLVGQLHGYNVLVQQFRIKDDPEMLGKVVIALNSCISGLLARPEIYQELLSQVFSWNWKTEMSINTAIIQLLFSIVATNATYLTNVFKLLVKSFLPEGTMAKDQPLDPSRSELLHQIHEVLVRIIQQVPTGLFELMKTVEDCFPHKRFSVNIQTEYIQQLFTLSMNFPALQSRILSIIVEKCLEMDVEIVIEDDGEVRLQRDFDFSSSLQGNEGSNVEDDYDFDEVFGGSSFKQSSSAAAGYRPQTIDGANTNIPSEVTELAEKLDSILSLITKYFRHCLTKYQQQSSASSELNKFYHLLMELFQHRLLLTHKSKFVQFIFFYVASQQKDFSELFARKLLEIVFNVHESLIIRQSAVMYLASYLSRASFLSLAFIREIVSDMLRWSTAYIIHYQAQSINLASNEEKRKSGLSSKSLDSQDENGPSYFYQLLYQTIQQRFQQELLIDLIFPTNNTSSVVGIPSTPSQDNLVANGNVSRYEYDEYGRLQIIHHKVLDHELFYLIIQSICYILCFYGVELIEDQLQSSSFLSHCWNVVFTSKFEPIRYVIKSIRTEFLKLAHMIKLFDPICWESFPMDVLYIDLSYADSDLSLTSPLLLYRKRSIRTLDNKSISSSTYCFLQPSSLSLSSSRSNLLMSPGGKAQLNNNSNMFSSLGPNTIESFFPFDPCLLMKIYYSIERCYRSWNGVPGLNEQQLLQSLLAVNGIGSVPQYAITSSISVHSSANIGVEINGEIFGEDICDFEDEEDDDDEGEEEDDESEDEENSLQHSHKSNNVPIPATKLISGEPEVAMSMSYTETYYSTSVTSSVRSDDEDGKSCSSSYSMSVTSSIPREQVMLELIKKSKR